MRLSDIIKKSTNQQQGPQGQQPVEQKVLPSETGVHVPLDKTFSSDNNLTQINRQLNKSVAAASQDAEPKIPVNTGFNCEDVYAQTITEVKDAHFLYEKSKELPRDVKSIPLIVDALKRDNETMVSFTAKTTPDIYIYGHTANILIISLSLGISLKLPEINLLNIGYLAFCLDIIALKKTNVSFKSGKITQQDISQISSFLPLDADIADRLKEAQENIKTAVSLIYSELKNKMPEKFKLDVMSQDEINTANQIIALTHVYETITHPVNQNSKLIPHEAVKVIINKNEGVFSPEVLKSFVKMVSIYPIGSYVKLNTSEIAKVTGLNIEMPTRPKVYILIDGNLVRSPQPRVVDLAASPMLFVKEAIDETKLNLADRKLAIELKAAKWWVKGI